MSGSSTAAPHADNPQRPAAQGLRLLNLRALAAQDRWQTAFWVAWTVLLVIKLALAATLAPFGDEAWYWQESRHLALGYSDLPPATAWLDASWVVYQLPRDFTKPTPIANPSASPGH